MQKLPKINRKKGKYIYISQKFYNQIFKYNLNLDLGMDISCWYNVQFNQSPLLF